MDDFWKSSQTLSHNVDYKLLSIILLYWKMFLCSHMMHIEVHIFTGPHMWKSVRCSGSFNASSAHLDTCINKIFSPVFCSMQLQPPCPPLSIQHGAVQAIWKKKWRSLHELPSQYSRTPLSLLQGGVLPRHGSTNYTQTSLQR